MRRTDDVDRLPVDPADRHAAVVADRGPALDASRSSTTRWPTSSPPAGACTPCSAGGPGSCPNEHEPWPLRRASLVSLDDELVAAAGCRRHADRPTRCCTPRACTRGSRCRCSPISVMRRRAGRVRSETSNVRTRAGRDAQLSADVAARRARRPHSVRVRYPVESRTLRTRNASQRPRGQASGAGVRDRRRLDARQDQVEVPARALEDRERLGGLLVGARAGDLVGRARRAPRGHRAGRVPARSAGSRRPRTGCRAARRSR